LKFNDSVEEFLDYVKITRSNGTYKMYKCKLNVLTRYFGERDIHSITKKDVIKFWGWRQNNFDNITNTTLNKYRNIMILLVDYHTDTRLNIPKLKENKKTIEIIDNRVLFTVISHLKSQEGYKEALRNLVLFKLLLDTGLRINELLNLQVRDFNFFENTIHVKITKTKRERYVFHNDDTKRLVRRLITRDNTRDYLFVSYKSQRRLTVDHVQNICFRIEKKLNLPYTIRPHRWRHTFATNFLRKGADLETLRLIMGHSNIKTTQRYLHLDNEFLRDQYFSLMKE
jgi:site-specific recombinase XerD